MDLKKCKSGHFFDGDKYSECPHCKNNIDKKIVNTLEKKKITENRETGNLTKSIYHTNVSDSKSSEKKYESIKTSESDETSVTFQQKNVEKSYISIKKTYEYGPVVGWLVGISGEKYGHSYELFATSNTIGSGTGNVVAIDDSRLCSVSHGVICYQVETGRFFMDSEHSDGKVKINGYSVSENVYVNYMDVLEIGASTYMLIPLCKDGFSWWQNVDTSEVQRTDTVTENSWNIQTSTSSNNIVIESIDDVMYQPDTNYIANYEGEEQDLTSVLISSPWRCDSCNALNAMMASTCRICGNKKG